MSQNRLSHTCWLIDDSKNGWKRLCVTVSLCNTGKAFRAISFHAFCSSILLHMQNNNKQPTKWRVRERMKTMTCNKCFGGHAARCHRTLSVII